MYDQASGLWSFRNWGLRTAFRSTYIICITFVGMSITSCPHSISDATTGSQSYSVPCSALCYDSSDWSLSAKFQAPSQGSEAFCLYLCSLHGEDNGWLLFWQCKPWKGDIVAIHTFPMRIFERERPFSLCAINYQIRCQRPASPSSLRIGFTRLRERINVQIPFFGDILSLIGEILKSMLLTLELIRPSPASSSGEYRTTRYV